MAAAAAPYAATFLPALLEEIKKSSNADLRLSASFSKPS
jgi:hypothetical protein